MTGYVSPYAALVPMRTSRLRAYVQELERYRLAAGTEGDAKFFARRIRLADEVLNERMVEAMINRGPGAEHGKGEQG